MRRPLALVAPCLLLGSATTIAVAWGCAAWINPEHAKPGVFTHAQVSSDLWEMNSTRKRAGHTRIDRVLSDISVSELADGSPHINWPNDVANIDDEGTYSKSQCGWPFLALTCFDSREATIHAPADEETGFEQPGRLHDGIELSPWTD